MASTFATMAVLNPKCLSLINNKLPPLRSSPEAPLPPECEDPPLHRLGPRGYHVRHHRHLRARTPAPRCPSRRVGTFQHPPTRA